MAPSFTDIIHQKRDGISTIIINRPQVRNAFRPRTVDEMLDAFHDAWNDDEIGVVILTGAGDRAFCSGGDQSVRTGAGYEDAEEPTRFRLVELHHAIRAIPKPVIAMVNGYAIGGGNVLQVICDLTIASDNAIFGQTGPRVGSFDAGFGTVFLSRIVGEKKAREIWFLCRQYTATEALEMGLVNKVVPQTELEAECIQWAREILALSPTALRLLKGSFNADTDWVYGLEHMAHGATNLFYQTAESQEGRNAFMEKRLPDFSPFRKQSW